jgi:poly(A) polymerase
MASTSLRHAAIAVVRRLRDCGHLAYFAGGCVRDMLLGREPKDYDVATSAQPPQIIEIFHRTREVGVQFGVVLVRQGGRWVEVATFRTDLSYSDGRHPDAVRFSTPQDDAQRRDFTINGMYFDPIEEKVIDYVGGQEDLAARRLRAIGEPAHRFAEDHLRVLRAVRFAAAYGCTIEPATWAAVREMAPTIRGVSAERIREELEKGFSGPHRTQVVRLMAEAGLLPYLWEGAAWSADHVRAALSILPHLPADAGFEQVLAALLLDRPLDEIHRICRALTCSNRTREHIAWLVEHKDTPAEPARLNLADLKLLMQSSHFDDLLAQFAAVCRAEGRSLAAYEEVQARAAAIAPEEVRPPPLVGGDDLKAMGLPEGPAFKTILDRVYYAQLNEELRSRAEALKAARELARDVPNE